DALALDQLEHELVLAIAQAVDRRGTRGIGRFALGKLDPARGQERAHPVVARLAVDVLVVVDQRVERNEALTGSLGAFAQERVEHLLPGRRVHARSLRQDAVEVEQAGPDARRQPSRRGLSPFPVSAPARIASGWG